ncbi:alcohol dehydrogenase [Secundilactobacillus malefermentans]|uniref:alcohol dehydrogenase n=1 Tax=Secundilactobacillus malefermentans TaxID=176292 RepID=UPI0011C750B9|nr:alcohol dehydrogenase [Secundilactobacillus malefermentans]QEA31874.1 alcohol dehydrogenase [Secundilactobacillus malefermentans]
MSARIDLTGQKFGRLTVIEPHGHSKNGNQRWLCQCKCGNMKVVDGYRLRHGTTLSCGCLRNEVSRYHLLTNEKTREQIGRIESLKSTWHPKSTDLRSANKSGVTGVNFDTFQNKWIARLYWKGSYRLNRSFRNKGDAIQARLDCEKQYLD